MRTSRSHVLTSSARSVSPDVGKSCSEVTGKNGNFEVGDRDGAVGATSAANPQRYGTAATRFATFSVHFSGEFPTTWVKPYLLQRVLSHGEVVTFPKCAREG